jgi:hypothetical protein
VLRRLRILLFSALLVAPALVVAATGTAGAEATGATAAQASSKIPTLLRDRAAKIGAALATRRSADLDQAQLTDLSANVLGVDARGGIDVLVHAAAPATAGQTAQLAALGATVLTNSADFAAVPGMELPNTGLVHAVVPYDRLDALAGLSWVTALRPALRPAVDVGPITAEGVPLHRADIAQANGLSGAGRRSAPSPTMWTASRTRSPRASCRPTCRWSSRPRTTATREPRCWRSSTTSRPAPRWRSPPRARRSPSTSTPSTSWPPPAPR